MAHLTFQALEEKACIARHFREIRSTRPLVSASTVLAYLRDPDICQNIDQYTCRHEWNMSAGEADESGGRILCVKCGLDGDA